MWLSRRRVSEPVKLLIVRFLGLKINERRAHAKVCVRAAHPYVAGVKGSDQINLVYKEALEVFFSQN